MKYLGARPRQTVDPTPVYEATQEPTGFADTNQDTTLTWTDGTRTFEIDPSGADYDIWHLGAKTTISANKSIVIPDVEGMHHIYFDAAGALQSTTTFAESLLNEYVYVANLYWDATNNEAVGIGDERHGLMPWQTHILVHDRWGTHLESGLGIGDILADQSGALDTHAECSVASGSIKDEDIRLALAGLAAPAGIPVIYKTGAAGEWRKAAVDTAPLLTTGTGRAAWNEYTGGAWQQTEAGVGKFVLMHLFASNDPRAGHQVVAIQGENVYNTKAGAREGANTEIGTLTTGVLPMQEFVALGTIIYQTGSYTNTWKSRIVTTDAGEDYVDWRSAELSPGTAPSSHPNLTNIEPDDHHAEAHTVASHSDTSATGAELDSLADGSRIGPAMHRHEAHILSMRNGNVQDLDGVNVAVQWTSTAHATKGTAISWSSGANTRITINEDGWYLLAANVYATSATARANISLQFRKDGTTVLGPISACGYIRYSSGHNESSVHIAAFSVYLTSGTYLEVIGNTLGAAGSWNSVANGGSVFAHQLMSNA